MAYLVNLAVFLSLMKHDKKYSFVSSTFDFDLEGKIHAIEHPVAGTQSLQQSYLNSTSCSTVILIYHLGFVQYARSGRST
jgi:hypothetical protein